MSQNRWKIWKVIICFMGLGMVAAKARACADGISVAEQASVSVVPDEAQVALSIETVDSDLDVALQKNSDASVDLKGYLRKEGARSVEMDPPIIETHFRPVNYATAEGPKSVTGYAVRTTVSFVVPRLSELKVLTSGALEHGASAVLATLLRSSQIDKARADARRQALEKAQARAIEAAKQVGQAPGLLTDIDESAPQLQSWSSFAILSAQRSDMYSQGNLLIAPSIYGPTVDQLSANRITVSSSVRVCLGFKEPTSREKR